jgi:phosphate starvation-inducible PhoH-like protein
LIEKNISLSEISLIEFLGVSNAHFQLLVDAFPQTKIICRGDQLTIRGSDDQIALVEAIVNQCIQHLNKHSTFTAIHMKAYIDSVLNPTGEETVTPWVEDKDVLLFGNKGIVIKAKTPNQRKLVDAANENDIVFAIGPAGTGKTYTAVALAVKALKNKEVKNAASLDEIKDMTALEYSSFLDGAKKNLSDDEYANFLDYFGRIRYGLKEHNL